MKLIKENYIGGAFLRKELNGYIDSKRFIFGDILIDFSKDRHIVKDLYIDKIKKYINIKSYEKYLSILDEFISPLEKFDNITNEELYGEINLLRKQFITNYTEIIEKEKKDYLKHICQKIQNSNNLKKLFLKIIYYNTTPGFQKYTSAIDDYNLLKIEINSSKNIIFIPGDYRQLPYILLLSNRLNADNIYILLKKESILNEPTTNDFLYLSRLIKFKNSIIPVEYYNNDIGINFKKININIKEKIKKIIKNSLVIATDEKMIFSLNNVNFEYFLLSKIQNIYSQRFTNLYITENKIPYIIAKIAPTTIHAERFSGVERIKKTLLHSRLNPQNLNQYYMNFYSTTYIPKNFSFKINSKKFNKIILERQNILNSFTAKWLKKREHNYIFSYYSLDSLKKIEYIPEKEKNAVMVNIVTLKNLNNITVTPIIGQNLIYPRNYVRTLNKEKNYLFLNFMYFATNKLVKWYNEKINSRPYEHIKFSNFYIDYQFKKIYDNHYLETFPLFNKGYIGLTENNEFIFGRKKISDGKIILNNVDISWKKENINKNIDTDIILYTPQYADSIKTIPDFKNFTLTVGKNRFNMVIINDKLIISRLGEVVLPPFGVVISIKKDLAKNYIQKIGFAKLEKNYYELKNYKLIIDINSNMDKKNIKWIYGGGTLIIENGKNLFKNTKLKTSEFKREGWFNILSMQTQETQLQKEERNPRSVIGISEKNEIFLATFSGRTKESKGVYYSELIKILEIEIGKIKYLLNLDGGASTCMGLIHKNEFFELNYPAVAPDSSAGMVRAINSFLLIEERKK